jgi:hypothetical protein
MRDRILKYMARWYYRNMYQPAALDPSQVVDPPPQHHVEGVPWISVREALCQSTALQMIAAHHGIEKPRRHFDFLMGFTYGASYRDDFGFLTVGTDPEMGLLTAAPYLGLVRRYYFTDDAALYLRALRSYLARDYPVRVPLDMGALYGQAEPLPHNEVLVGYDAGGFRYFEPVSRPPAPTQPGRRPPGDPGLYVTEERLLQAVSSESETFGYPWRYPFVIFEAGPCSDDLGPVWRQNGQALLGGNRWGQRWGAAAIEHQAAEIERAGKHFDFSRVALGLEVGAATRPDNATHLRDTFAGRSDLQQAAGRFDEAAGCYRTALDAIAGGLGGRTVATAVVDSLRQAAAAERAAGRLFLSQAGPARASSK